MKKMRKGFTLIELLVVIGVMGIMSSLAMVGGQQATDAARATNIADGLEKAASAMMMYYSDNADEINEKGAKVADVTTGANAYLKTKLASAAGAGKYYVMFSAADSTVGAKWYVAYQFLTTDDALKAMIANKATRMQLFDASKVTEESPAAYVGTTNNDTTTYPDAVAMLVR